MKYIKKIGIIYDCIYYGILTFSDPLGSMKINDYLNKNIKNIVIPDQCLYTLFYTDVKDSPPLVEYFKANIFETNYYKNGMDDFTNLINDKVKFKNFVFNYILYDSNMNEIDCCDIDIKKLNSLLNDLKYSKPMIIAYVQLFTRFEIYTNRLIEYLDNIYHIFAEVHEEFDKDIKKCLTKLKTKKMTKKIIGKSESDMLLIKNANVAISIINKYMVFKFYDGDENKLFLLIGYLISEFCNVSFLGGDISIMDNYNDTSLYNFTQSQIIAN